jgi:hypothetical protein
MRMLDGFELDALPSLGPKQLYTWRPAARSDEPAQFPFNKLTLQLSS